MGKRKKLPAISLRNVSKTYLVKHQKPTFLGQVFKQEKRAKFTAVNDVSFDVFSGERLGILGNNGAGKTTLLQLISGITVPSAGTIDVQGKVVSLISLDAGFHPEMTGYENIYLNGLIVGMRKQEISDKIDEIIKFANIGEFIDAPIYTYSSGMMLRLGFSIAVHADPDVLLLDEYIIVGDKYFKNKARKKIIELAEKGKTMVLVSQEVKYIKRYCKRVIEIDKGMILSDTDSVEHLVDLNL